MKSLNLIKVAQEYKEPKQLVLPGLFYTKNRNRRRDLETQERMAPYNIEYKGAPYWGCFYCKQPVTDIDGNLARTPDDVDYFEKSIGVEEFPNKQKTLNILESKKILDRHKALVSEQIDYYYTKCIGELVELIKNTNKDEIKNRYCRDFIEFFHSFEDIVKNNITELNQKIMSNEEFFDFLSNFDELFIKDYNDITKKYTKSLGQNYNWYRLNNKAYEILSVGGLARTIEEFFKESYISSFDALYNVEKKLNNAIKGHERIWEFETSRKYNILHPVCLKCSDLAHIYCSNCNAKSRDEDDFVYVDELPYCKQHAYKCEGCNETFESDGGGDEERQLRHSDYDDKDYCDRCYCKTFEMCSECNQECLREDAHYEDDEILCDKCYSKINKPLDTRFIKNIKKAVIPNLTNFYPIDQQTIEKKLIPGLELAKKKGATVDSLIEFLDSKKIFSEQNKKIVFATISAITKRIFKIDDIINIFKKQLERISEFKQAYLEYKKEVKFYPVDIEIEPANTDVGTVFAIYPKDAMLDIAEQIVPGAKEAYSNVIERHGHHRGALAYARVTEDRAGNIIIDNLQTDVDVFAFDQTKREKYPALDWWAKSIDKFWVPYLLHLLRQIGNELDSKVFLTSYEMQQQKWRRIPERNKEFYDFTPEKMGFPLEEVDTKPTGLESGSYEMRRIADFYIDSLKLLR